MDSLLGLNSLMTQISLSMAALLLFPLIVMATTLPQAVLLWSEPDLSPSEEELSSVPPADHITKSKRVGVGR
jgi:hypothetical protein